MVYTKRQFFSFLKKQKGVVGRIRGLEQRGGLCFSASFFMEESHASDDEGSPQNSSLRSYAKADRVPGARTESGQTGYHLKRGCSTGLHGRIP